MVKLIFIIFTLQSFLLLGNNYNYSSNIYQQYLNKAYKNYSVEKKYSIFILKKLYEFNNNFKKFKKNLPLKLQQQIKNSPPKKMKLIPIKNYPLLNLLYKYNKIITNKEKFNFIMKITNPIIKDYFELKYYQRIDNQIEYQKKINSINKFDIFLTLPFLINELKFTNHNKYQKLVKDLYKNNKNNIGILLYYEDEFIENRLNLDLIDNYFLNNKFHIDKLIEKFKKFPYKIAIKKIIKLINLHPKSIRIFSKVILWNNFFRKDKDFIDIIANYPFTRKNPYLLYQITKLSIGEVSKTNNSIKETLEKLKKIPEAKNMYNFFFKKEIIHINSDFFKKQLTSLSYKELNNENKILNLEKNISFNKNMDYNIELKEAIYFGNIKLNNLFYEIFYIDNEELIEVKNAYIYKNNGEIIKINNYDSIIPYEYDGLYSDMKILKFNLKPYLKKGDIFYISYKITSTHKRDYFNHKISMLENIKPKSDIVHYKYSIKFPKSIKFNIAYNKKYLIKKLLKTNKYNIINFTSENLKQYIPENFYYFSYKEEPYISISNFKNWNDVETWFHSIIFDKTYSLNNKNKKQFKKMIQDKNITNKEDIIKYFYNYILDNIHYVGIELGIHSYKPYNPNIVLENKYGDCKDRALLFYNIMKLFNINAKIVLVSTSDSGVFNFDIPSYSYFNHAIIYIPSINKYLDLTNKNIPYSSLPQSDINSDILILSPNEVAQKIIFKSNEVIKKEFEYNKNNNDIAIKEKIYYYGDIFKQKLRVDFSDMKKSIYERYINNYYNNILSNFTYKSKDTPRINPIKFTFNYSFKNKTNNNNLIMKLFQDNDLFENRFAPTKIRVNSFNFIVKPKYEYIFKIKNMKHIYSFNNIEINNSFFYAKLKRKKGIIKFNFKMKVNHISAEENNDFKKKLNTLDKILQRKYYVEFK